MTNSENALGGRLPLVDPANLSPAQHALWERIDATMAPWAERVGFETKTSAGRYVGPFNPMLLSPEMGLRFLELQIDERRLSRLEARVREVVILSVGAVWRSDYELYAHGASARAAGFSDDAVKALSSGEPSRELKPQEALAQRLALALSQRHAVDDSLYRESVASFGESGLVDLVVLAGCYELICGLLNLFAIPAPASKQKE